MTKVKVEHRDNEEIEFKQGDLVEYPDGVIIMVIDEEPAHDEALSGVVLRGGGKSDYNIGHQNTCFNKFYVTYSDKKPKKFNGKLILEQYDNEE